MNSEKASSKKTLSQKEYLKRYLSKSKPKKRPIKRANVKVIDDNDLTGFHTEENNDLEVGEDAPVIAAIIDERPKTIQRLEEYKTSNRWAPVPAVDEVSNKSSDKQNRGDRVEQDNIRGDDESRHNSPTTESKSSRGNDPSFKKHRPSKPETIQASSHKKSEYSKNRSHEHSSSPPLPEESCLKNSRDLNTKNHKRYGTLSPEKKSSYKKRRYSSDENSPPRKIKYSKESEKSRREKRREESFSPDRCELKSRKKDQEVSKTKKKRSSLSPDHEMSEKKSKKRDKFSPEHFSNGSRDRKRKMDEKVRGSSSSKKKRDMDSSERSPPSHESRRIKKNRASSVDSSPMHYDKVKKKKKKDRRSSPKRTIKKRSSSSSSYSSDQNNDRKSKRSFNKKEKYRENNSGVAAVSEKSRDYDKKGKVKERHSSPVNEKTEKYSPSRYSSRSKNGMENEDKTINSKRNSKNESERHDRKADVESNENKKKPTAEEYYQWGKGLKQIEDENEKLAYDLREMSKPLARYKDDEDLDKHLKYMERDGDPLLIIKRNADEDDNSKPRYKGTFPQNRFGIAPGHKWDGVDRSNGYEVKWLGKAKAKEAVEEEAYKWSTADM